jgi:hypothetical protein
VLSCNARVPPLATAGNGTDADVTEPGMNATPYVRPRDAELMLVGAFPATRRIAPATSSSAEAGRYRCFVHVRSVNTHILLKNGKSVTFLRGSTHERSQVRNPPRPSLPSST